MVPETRQFAAVASHANGVLGPPEDDSDLGHV
jgi:hypothetical protein